MHLPLTGLGLVFLLYFEEDFHVSMVPRNSDSVQIKLLDTMIKLIGNLLATTLIIIFLYTRSHVTNAGTPGGKRACALAFISSSLQSTEGKDTMQYNTI